MISVDANALLHEPPYEVHKEEEKVMIQQLKGLSQQKLVVTEFRCVQE